MSLPAQIPGWEFTFAQLSAGSFDATGVVAPLGSMLLGVMEFNQSLLARVRPPTGCLSIVLPRRSASPVFCRGKEVVEGQCIVLSSRTDCEWITRRRFQGVTLTLCDDVWRAISDGACSLAMQRGAYVRTLGALWSHPLLGAIDWLHDFCRRNLSWEHSLSFRATCENLLIFHLLGALENTAPAGADRRERLHRRIAVERARTFIHEHLASPICLADLCVHARAQARSLEYGFREVLGASPVAYIRAMRLNRAHHLLSSPSGGVRTVTEIALDCGFGHLGQFAVDYRKLFGKRPSDTLRGVRARTCAPSAH